MNTIKGQINIAIMALRKVKDLTRPGSGAWLAADEALKVLEEEVSV